MIYGGLTGGGLPGGGLTRDGLTRNAPVDGGLTGDRLPAGALTGVCLNGVVWDELSPERYAVGQLAGKVRRGPALDVAADALGDPVPLAVQELPRAGER